jgi:hypothetical protein
MQNSNNLSTSCPTREEVVAANPLFFAPQTMIFFDTTHKDWAIESFNGECCVIVNRPICQARACYRIDSFTYELSFRCHIGAKLTYI